MRTAAKILPTKALSRCSEMGAYPLHGREENVHRRSSASLSSTSLMHIGRFSRTRRWLTSKNDAQLAQDSFFQTSSHQRNYRLIRRSSIRWTTACGPFWRSKPVLSFTKVWRRWSTVCVGNGIDCRRRTSNPSLKITSKSACRFWRRQLWNRLNILLPEVHVIVTNC